MYVFDVKQHNYSFTLVIDNDFLLHTVTSITAHHSLAEPREARARVHRKIERWGWERDRISGLTEHQVESKVFCGRRFGWVATMVPLSCAQVPVLSRQTGSVGYHGNDATCGVHVLAAVHLSHNATCIII